MQRLDASRVRAPRVERSALLFSCALALCSCGEEPTEVGCAFGEARLVARAEGTTFDGVELIASGDGALLVWSDRSGLYARELDASGAPRAEARRLGTRCPGGVAVTADGDSTLVACARPVDRDRGRDGAIVLLRLEDGAVRAAGRVEPVGAESYGVEVLRHGGRTLVGYRDADVFVARARLAEVEGERVEARALSSEGTLASAPSLAIHDGALVLAWTESWFDRGGRPAGHLFTMREGDPPRPSLDVGDVDVRVSLATDTRGPMVALRDRRPRGSEPRAFAGRLDDRLRLTLPALRSPGRADDPDARPVLVPCGDHTFSVATRTSSRQVTMVSIRRLDDELRSVEAEHQIYEYHARFVRAAGACVDGRLLLAVGERQTEVSPVPRLHTYALRCGPGVAHARTPGVEGQVLRKRGATRP